MSCYKRENESAKLGYVKNERISFYEHRGKIIIFPKYKGKTVIFVKVEILKCLDLCSD